MGEVSRDGQAQAGAAQLAAPRLVDPIEALEDPWQVLGGDAGAVVLDFHDRAAVERGAYPQLHIHAFSPEEQDFAHRKSGGMPLAELQKWLVEGGLDTMPGTAAEILDDEIRGIISPRKLKRARWIEIIESAHGIGLPSTSTMMSRLRPVITSASPTPSTRARSPVVNAPSPSMTLRVSSGSRQ